MPPGVGASRAGDLRVTLSRNKRSLIVAVFLFMFLVRTPYTPSISHPNSQQRAAPPAFRRNHKDAPGSGSAAPQPHSRPGTTPPTQRPRRVKRSSTPATEAEEHEVSVCWGRQLVRCPSVAGLTCSLPMGMAAAALQRLNSSSKNPASSRPNTSATRPVRALGSPCFVTAVSAVRWEWSCREAAGGIPESAREPSPVYPAARVGTPADPNIPRVGSHLHVL